MNEKSGKMWKEAVVAHVKIILQNFLEVNEKNIT
jgi:hypothetical protein